MAKRKPKPECTNTEPFGPDGEPQKFILVADQCPCCWPHNRPASFLTKSDGKAFIHRICESCAVYLDEVSRLDWACRILAAP